MDTTQQNQQYTLNAIREKLLPMGEFLYGSTQRTYTTLAVTFAMLVGGISMMQYAASGKAACALIGG